MSLDSALALKGAALVLLAGVTAQRVYKQRSARKPTPKGDVSPGREEKTEVISNDPLPYKGYLQKDLDHQYDVRAFVPSWEEWSNLYAKKSEEARERFASSAIFNVKYGTHEREVLDVFPAKRLSSRVISFSGNVLLFIHGGYWSTRDKDQFAFVAPPFVEKGVTVVTMSYPLCPHVTMDRIVESVKRAMTWIYTHSAKDTRLFISGHSAGGHLAVAAVSPIPSHLPPNFIRAVCAMSGVYDLTPITFLTKNAEMIGLDSRVSALVSPINSIPESKSAPPLVLAVGGEESAEFQSQTEDLASAWKRKGLRVSTVDMPKHNHYSIVSEFADSTSVLFQTFYREIAKED